MDSTNSYFLDPLPLNNANAIGFIKDTMVTFIGGAAAHENPLYAALYSKCKCVVKDDFIQINKAVFKEAEPFIFYKLGYDYKKFQTVKATFYKYLYVADKLIRLCSDAVAAAATVTAAKTSDDKNYQKDAYYTKCLKKLFKDSGNFSRQMSNPITAKSDEKINGFFDILQNAVIQYPRLTRQLHKDDLKQLDKTAKEYKAKIDASEKQKLKLEKAINDLLQEHSGQKQTFEYILKQLINGTGIKKEDTTSAANGGKAKRRRRKGGGADEVNPVECIIGYFENNEIFNIQNTDIKRNDRTGVYTVTITKENFEIIKSRYNKHPMIIIDKRLESMV